MTPVESTRRLELLAAAKDRPLDHDEVAEIGRLEKAHHAFRLLCTRTAPLNPMALGYMWDERIEHSAAPHMPARVRTEGMVDVDGETVTLMEATRRIASAVSKGIALADWNGSAGRLGDIAGLEHPPRAAEPAKPARPAPPQAAMGDLFD